MLKKRFIRRKPKKLSRIRNKRRKPQKLSRTGNKCFKKRIRDSVIEANAITQENNKNYYINIFESEIKAIAEQVETWGSLETGGELYGCFLHNGTLVIMFAAPPGRNAMHRTSIFQQDYHFFLEASSLLFDLFSLVFVGNWHSHHFMDIKTLSRTDIVNLNQIAQKNNFKCLSQILVTFDPDPEIGNFQQPNECKTDIKFYYYSDAATGSPQKCIVKVIPGMSPIRKAIEQDVELKSILTVPQKETLNKVSVNEYRPNSGHRNIFLHSVSGQVDQFAEKNNLLIQHKTEGNFIVFQVPLFAKNDSLFIAHDIRTPHRISSIFYKINSLSDRPVNISDEILANERAISCFDYAFQLSKKLIIRQVSQLQSCESAEQKLLPGSSGHVTQTDGGIQ